MSEAVNVYEAKTQLSRLLTRVEAGEEIVIARSGVPIARLVPEPKGTTRRPRKSGGLRGKAWLADDWDSDATNEAIAETFGAAK